MWTCGHVDLWTCGLVDLWTFLIGPLGINVLMEIFFFNLIQSKIHNAIQMADNQISIVLVLFYIKLRG